MGFPDALSAYATALHTAIGTEHHVASPLGAWVVLALAAPAATGAERATIEEVLGEPADEAAERAAALLAEPHPLVAAAAALWARESVPTDWATGVQKGPLPSQAEADAWASENTRGLIDAFPLTLTPEVVLVLASALGTDVSWTVPFETTTAEALGDSEWAGELTTALRAPSGHTVRIVADDEAGDVVVHSTEAKPLEGWSDGLTVVSVIGAPDVPASAVLAAAHRAALHGVHGQSLFDLPLGEGHAWTITEEDAPTRTESGREEAYDAVLPAWTASSDHDLLADASLGFDAAGSAVAGLIGPGLGIGARQVARAEYTRVGFRAAAVTAMAWMTSAPPAPRPGIRRTATVRFGRPYAVVAVARQHGGPWHGVPVFSAWVAEPSDAS
ncbi:hypothetical protein [Cryptosporangium sp. NPDC048952]|uniref:hypothetical protein n=1 Tax=Cryptosporangium sp. NPDC048952 TaxID=3363961 RepID=UPI00371FA1C4